MIDELISATMFNRTYPIPQIDYIKGIPISKYIESSD